MTDTYGDELIAKLEEARREMKLQFDCASYLYWEGRAEAFEEARP
jgi:hypothetical protein